MKGVGGGLKFAQVACGAFHTVCLARNGALYSFGQGIFGALGHGDEDNRDIPTCVDSLWAVGVIQVKRRGISH